MPTLTQSTATFVAAILLLCLVLWLWRSARQQNLPDSLRARSSGMRLTLLSAAALASLLLLSGCGTARSPVLMCPPAPAALLVPPQEPTLLVPMTPASRSMTPGTTTPSTPAPAPKTGSGTAP